MSFDIRVPKTLLELQKWMGTMLVLPLRNMEGDHRFPTYEESLVAEIEKRITPGPFLSAAQRMGIHNQQFWFRMFTLMQERFAVLTRLFGYFDFNRKLVEPYLLKYPPDSWSLAVLGNRFPQWIEEEYKEEDRDLVYQIALIEEAHKRLLFARHLPPLKKEELPNIVDQPLFLQPSIALFELDADFFAFRLALLEKEVEEWEQIGFPRVDWFEQKRFFILFMQGEKLFYEEITREEHQILKAFQRGAKLEKALSSLEKEVPVQEWFQKWSERGWLTCKAALHSENASEE